MVFALLEGLAASAKGFRLLLLLITPQERRSVECRASGAPTARRGTRIIFGIDFPALPGWADVWRSALRALHLQRSLPCHFSLNWPLASQLLPRHAGAGGMTKGNPAFAAIVWMLCVDTR